jgi:glycosyltransferase involved in cell wall biosynthesis
MTVSLLIPCYNGARFLPRLAESVRAQTRPFDEILCYDDGSTDASVAVARELGFTVIAGGENRGPAHARNALLAAASAPWIHFHDADDLMAPTFLAEMIARISGEADVIICDAEWRAEGTRELQLRWSYSAEELRADPVRYLLSHPVGGINGLYRRERVQAIGGFNPALRIWEDADLHVRLALAGARFVAVERPLVTALRHGNSISTPVLPNWQSRLAALEGYASTFPSHLAPAIVTELDQAARALLRNGDSAGAVEAFRVATKLGGDLPLSAHPLLRLVKRVLGPLVALRIQTLVRPS